MHVQVKDPSVFEHAAFWSHGVPSLHSSMSSRVNNYENVQCTDDVLYLPTQTLPFSLYPVSQGQENDPILFVHMLFGPHAVGDRHSSISTAETMITWVRINVAFALTNAGTSICHESRVTVTLITSRSVDALAILRTTGSSLTALINIWNKTGTWLLILNLCTMVVEADLSSSRCIAGLMSS